MSRTNTPYSTRVKGKETRAIIQNSAACRLFGGAKEWLVGHAMTACFTPGLELPVASEDGQSGAVRATCLRVDGSLFQADIFYVRFNSLSHEARHVY